MNPNSTLQGAAWTRLAAGLVTTRPQGTDSAVAAGPRCAVTREGEVVCSYTVQTALGSNDFAPMISRSTDHGITWSEQGPIWPQLRGKFSIFGSVSRSPAGELFFFGTRTPIDGPGESFWSDATQGLKANELVWARSSDGGHHWSEPTLIPMPFPGSAEAPGAMCVAADGTWHVCYSPYNTFDPKLVVPRNQVVALRSADQGRSWRSGAMLRFADELSTAAEAWIVELADGRLLGSCWNMNQRDGSDYSNAYGLSSDGGATWRPTRSTGIFGQSIALTPLADGSALFLYNQRKAADPGVWMAQVRPTELEFGVVSNERIWQATSNSTAGPHSQWTNFTFGEPSATVLNDGSILVVLWCVEEGIGSIRYVKLRRSA